MANEVNDSLTHRRDAAPPVSNRNLPNDGSQLRPVVQLENFAGKYIAWNLAQTQIVATAPTLEDVFTAAKEAGEAKPIIEKIPKRMRHIWELA